MRAIRYLGPPFPTHFTPVKATLEDPDREISAVTWKWEESTDKSSWTAITGNAADTESYTPQTEDVDNYLRATATYTFPNVIGSVEKPFSPATDNLR